MYNYDLQKYNIEFGSNESSLKTVSNEYVQQATMHKFIRNA